MKHRNSFLILCFVLISFGVALVSAQQCMNTSTFRLNRIYNANRHLILSSLPSIVTAQGGFYSGSVGQEPDRVFATGMCIPGSAPDDCYDCIKKASDGLIQSCPNQTDAYTWPGEPTLCHVRYSNTCFSGSADLDPRKLLYNTRDLNSNLTEFKTIWEDLIGRMIAAASAAKSTPSSSNNHYTADVQALTAFQNIYTLMQCTPDLSSGDCDSCLRQSISDYQLCCGQKQGGVIMRPSCYFRWELHTFSKAFGNITVAPLQPPVTVPHPPSNSTGDRANTSDNNDFKGISAGILLVITVQTVVIILILFVLGLVLFRRRTELQSDNHVSTIHSLAI